MVIVKDFSRIGRNMIEVGKWIEDCRKAGIEIISMTEGLLTLSDEQAQTYHKLLAAFAKGWWRI
jgi:DNA invertase Pin-like site-specific DNA recombinase